MSRNFGFSPYSSDVEQPLCRRRRADSSPAAGTRFVSRRQHVGETMLPAPLAYTQHHANENLFPLPSGSMRDQPARAALELLNPRHALLEVVVGGITGLGLVFAFFLLLFCQF